MPLDVGHTLGRYRITATLGAGGMGEVYRAHDTRLDRDVAVKLLKATGDGDGARAAILTEARAVSALSHPHVCTLHEVDEADGQSFLVMELVDGRTLASMAARPLPADTVADYGAQIASALAHAHQRGVVHCDLKPANVVVTPEGTVKVLDFGISRRLTTAIAGDTTRTMLGAEAPRLVAGTLPYVAPERLRGAAPDARGDIWGLGIVLFELLTGARPFQGSTAVDVSSQILQAPTPDLPAQVPPGLRLIVQRCLKKEAGERYQHASEVQAALEAVRGTGTQAPSRRRRWTPAIFGGLLAAAAVAVAALWATSRWSDTPEIDSLVVLPFADLTPGPESEYLADGVTDAMITELGQLGALRVTSRTSSLRYRDSAKTIPDIARELGVESVLEGTLFRSGDRLRVTARLVRASTQSSIWTGSYERELRDILGLQRELARTVARELRVTMAATAAASPAPTVDPAAHDAYLRGRYQWAKRTQASLLQAVELFDTAVRLDPAYAAPHAGLAGTYVLLGLSSIVERPSDEAMRAAKTAAARALELDPQQAEAHAALGYAELWSWNLPASRRAFDRAIALNPSDANTRFWNAIRLAAERQFDESVAEAQRGRDLDPVSPIVTAGVAWACHLAGRHGEAERYARMVLDLEPDLPSA